MFAVGVFVSGFMIVVGFRTFLVGLSRNEGKVAIGGGVITGLGVAFGLAIGW